MSYTLPNGTTLSFDECLNELRFTRDFDMYINMLNMLKEQFLIVVSVKGAFAQNHCSVIEEKLREILFLNCADMGTKDKYVGIVKNNNIYFREIIKDSKERVIYENSSDSLTIKQSKNEIQIIIDGTNCSVSFTSKNLNIVVFDYVSNKIVDSAFCDLETSSDIICHKNIKYTEQYVENHFYLYEKYKKAICTGFEVSYFSNKALNAVTVKNAIVEPIRRIGGRSQGGVCDENFKIIAGHANFSINGNTNARYITSSYNVHPDELDYCDEDVIWGGVMYDHPGHLIIESIADRLWYWVKNNDTTKRIAVTVSWGDGNGRFLKEFMEALGIPDELLIFVIKPTKFASVTIPDASEYVHKWPYSCEFTREYISVFDYIRSRAVSRDCKKIYLTKSKTNLSNIVGENFFIDFYRNKGFTIINPEDYTIREKVELLIDADEVVTPDGTNVLYAIFCRHLSKLTILTRTNAEINSGDLIPLEASNIKEIYIVNVAGGFLHKHFVFGIGLMVVTPQFVDYVSNVYNESLSVTPEQSVKENLYEYLKKFPQYFTNPYLFSFIKNQKMYSVIQNISELFYGENFDTSQFNVDPNYSLRTREDDLSDQINQLTADLNTYKKRITELESTDIFKAAELLEATNVKFEEQLSQIHKTQQSTIQDLQTKNEVLIGKNAGLEQSLKQKAVEINKRDATIYELSEKLLDAQSKEIELKDKIIVQEQLRQEQITKIAELEKQISDYEQLQSKRGKFFKSRKGND